jgi:hypothetical protein
LRIFKHLSGHIIVGDLMTHGGKPKGNLPQTSTDIQHSQALLGIEIRQYR